MKLNIQKFAVTKSTTFAESNLDATNNTSTLKITITFSANNQQTYFSSATLKCICNGVKQSKTVSHPAGGEVKKTFTFNDIQHNADGSKTVSWSWSCATGTQVLGTVSASGTRALTTLHTPPTLNSVSFVETNPALLNIGLTNQFVLGLSQKQFTINATYEDDAVYNHLELINQYGTKTGSPYETFQIQNINVLNTTNDILDLSTVELKTLTDFTTTPRTNAVRLKYKLYDSLNGTAETQYNDYDYIQYTNFTINSSAKRVGQTSGQVSISCNGNYFDGQIGNKNQKASNNYVPTIKYKFWKYGDTEPLTYENEVLSGISVSDGIYSLSNLYIGNTTEGTTNYFNPKYSYRVKIQVSDNFTSIESPELSIAVGEATWTEFKDYVDFKAITIQHEPIITIEEYEEYTGEVTSSSNKALTYNIAKTGYKAIGIVGVLASGTRSSYINIYAFSISNNGTEGNVNIKNTHGSSSLVANDTTVKIYVAYIRS